VVLKSHLYTDAFDGADISFNLEHITVTGQNLLNTTGDEVSPSGNENLTLPKSIQTLQ
jgi:hypothetical protein